jgi:hypothetical protein
MKNLVLAVSATLALASTIGCAAPADPEPSSARVDISGPASANASDVLTMELADGPQLDALLAALRTSASEVVQAEDRVRVVVRGSKGFASEPRTFFVSRKSCEAWSTPLAAGDATVVHLPAFLEKIRVDEPSADESHSLIFGWSWNDVVITTKYTLGCYQTLSNGDVVDNCRL